MRTGKRAVRPLGEVDKLSLINECRPLVRRLAARLAARLPAQIELEDLTQTGLVGVLDAIDRFDASRGVRFWTYAELRIRGAMIDSLRALDWLPRSVRRRQRHIEATRTELQARLGRSVSEAELAAELDIGIGELHSALSEPRTVEITGEEPEPASSTPLSMDPEQALESKELKRLLAQCIEGLPERERLVVTLYYHEELTLKEVGAVLGVKESRVSQIHSKAVRRLRMRVANALRPRRPEAA